jgi:hypothetical protein
MTGQLSSSFPTHQPPRRSLAKACPPRPCVSESCFFVSVQNLHYGAKLKLEV